MTWRSYHLFHHENRDRVIEWVVVPVTATLWARGGIDRFFFVRLGLGGPHVRFRLRCRDGFVEETDGAVERAAEELYRRFPSSASLDDETIRRANRAILASDPRETDDRVHRDNSWLMVPFHPEVDRYGGPERFRHSLDFFCLSSSEALTHLCETAGATRGRCLTAGLRILLRQAWGFARSERELRRLLGTVVQIWGESFPAAIRKGDAEFARQRVALAALARRELDCLSSGEAPAVRPGDSGWIVRAARHLSHVIGSGDGSEREVRWRIGASQLHMTANRLGFLNSEEVYLSRLLQLAVDELRHSDPPRWDRLARKLRRRRHEPPAGSPDRLVEAAFRQVADLAARLTPSSAEI